MQKYKAIIVEDLQQDVDLLQHLLQNHFAKQISVVGTAAGMQSAIELLQKQKIDLLFCDIELDEGSTSFDILAYFEKNELPITFEIIFMTAHDNQSYYTKAFDYEAIDYLRKPFGIEQLQRAIDRAEKNIALNNHAEKYRNMYELLIKNNQEISSHLTVHLPQNKLRRLVINDILYIEADTVQSNFYLVGGEKLVAMRNLGVYRKILELEHNFFSISHGTTVNLNHLKHYQHHNLSLSLSSGHIIYASRQGGQRFKAYLEDKSPKVLPQNSENLLAKIKGFLGI
jgi:two-component system, LytTR family, response regulator